MPWHLKQSIKKCSTFFGGIAGSVAVTDVLRLLRRFGGGESISEGDSGDGSAAGAGTGAAVGGISRTFSSAVRFWAVLRAAFSVRVDIAFETIKGNEYAPAWALRFELDIR